MGSFSGGYDSGKTQFSLNSVRAIDQIPGLLWGKDFNLDPT